MESRDDQLKQLGALIQDTRIAMLTTIEESGELRSRPMAVQNREFDGELWFFTQEHSPKVEEIHQEREVNVTFVNRDKQDYVSVSGTAVLVRDRSKIEEFWSPVLKTWFPGGVEDPELALIKVIVRNAEYWDGPSSKIVQVFGMAKAALIGEQYDAGENVKLDLSRAEAG